MVAEKSLLQKIREKELEISIQLDAVRTEMENSILRARGEATEFLHQAEQEGERSAQEYYKEEMEKIQSEIAGLRDAGRKEIDSVREKGEGRLPEARERIVRAVAPE